MAKNIILKPRLSEKAYALSEEVNTYVFDIPAHANRADVIKSVGSKYEVKVRSARLARSPAKIRRRYSKQGRKWYKGESSAVRKAYVSLEEGEKIPLFAGTEEAKEKK